MRFLAKLAALLILTALPASATTYYLANASTSPAGNDSNNGTSPSTPWLSPNHALNCGDVIIAVASTSYVASNFNDDFGTVTCAGGNNVAWLECASFDGCKISSSSTNGIRVNKSYWGLEGWETTTTSSGNSCFAVRSGSGVIHHIVFANNIANGCQNGGFNAFDTSTSASFDYVAYIGNIAYNASQGSSACYSGFNFYQPIQSDSAAGTHLYMAGNFAWGNVDPNPCNGGTPTDGEGFIVDTPDFSQGSGTAYARQIVVQNNISVGNGGRGIQIFNNVAGSSHAPIYVKYNTTYGNETDTHQNTGGSCGEIRILNALNTQTTNNLTQTAASTGCGGYNLYAYFIAPTMGTSDLISANWGYSASGFNAGLQTPASGFSYGTNAFGTSASFVNATIPGAPSCGSATSVPNCMATLISNFTPTATGSTAYGYQKPLLTAVHDALFPAWLCNVNLPSGLVTMGCSNSTAYYISYSAGSNANTGLSESVPWKSHPYMQSAAGCGGALPTYTHNAGDKFTFKQGDSWPNACFDMVIAAGGSSNTVTDLYTFDPTWGTAGGTTGNAGQPVGVYRFTAGGTVINGSDGLNKFIYDNGNNFIQFNGVEFTGMSWTGCPAFGNAFMVDIQESTNVTLTNAYAHNWTHSGATCDALTVIAGNGNSPFNVSSGLEDSVVDGTDSGGSGVADSGAATFAVPICERSIIKNVTNGCLLNANGVAHDDLIGPVNQSFDLSNHENCIEPIDMIAGGISLVYIYNNVLHDCTAVNILTQGAAPNNGREFDYIWNNVLYVGSVVTPPIPLQFDSISTSNNGSQVHAWANTIVGGTGDVCMRTIDRGNGNFEVLDVQNNHCISNQGTISLGITGNTYTNNNNVLMSVATATAQGYTSSQTYAYSPTAATNGTVGAGANLSYLETLNPPGYPVASIADDTTYGGTRLPNIRPSVWDTGAYQFKNLVSGNFYVDNCVVVGNDSNNGTSPSTPWLTIGQVNLLGFQPGSTVSLRSTCLWRETLTPPSSGTAGSPITFTAYGTGAAPILDGAFLTSNWISGEPTVQSYQVSTNNDNGYDDGTYLYANTQTLGIASSDATVRSGGMRFQNVTESQGVSIYQATFSGKIYPGDTINVSVYGDNEDNAANFAAPGGGVLCTSYAAECPKNRPKTSQTVNWATVTSGSYQSVDVTTIVQALVNRAGWSSGNALAILTSSQNTVPLVGAIYSDTFPNGSALLSITTVTPAANIYAIPFTWVDKFDPPGAVFFDGIKVAQSVASLGALTGNNEWFYDYANLAPFLYIYSTTDPAGRTIEISDKTRGSAVLISGRDYVTVSNLLLERGANEDVLVSGNSNILLLNNEYKQSASIGVGLEVGTSNISVIGGRSHDNGGLPQGDSDGIGIGGPAPGISGVTVSGVEVDHNANLGIESYQTPATTGVRLLQYNYVHDNGNCTVDPTRCAGLGIQIDGGGTQTTTVQNNVVANNTNDGLQVTHIGAGITAFLYGNTVSANGGNCIDAIAGAVTFKNNLCFNNDTATGYFEANVPSTVTSWTSDYNDFWETGGGNIMQWQGTPETFAGFQTASGGDAHSLSADPKVTNAGTNSFTLTPTSPLISAGANLGTQYENALLPATMWPNGVVTGNQNLYGAGWEIGAFLFQSIFGSTLTPGSTLTSGSTLQ